MKILVAVLVLIIAIQSYGIYGGFHAERVTVTCTMELGPLCYAWELNALGKLLGPERALKLDEKLSSVKDEWEDEFADRLKQKIELEDGLKAGEKKIVEGIEKLLDTFTDIRDD